MSGFVVTALRFLAWLDVFVALICVVVNVATPGAQPPDEWQIQVRAMASAALNFALAERLESARGSR